MKRVLLIDGDVLAYKFAAGSEESVAWEDPQHAEDPGIVSTYVDLGEAIAHVDSFIEWMMSEVRANEYQVYLTSSLGNFRNKIWPDYKSNRKGKKKPIALRELRNHLMIHHNPVVEDFLEADDLLGMRMTAPARGEELICATIDKDLLTIVGNHYNWDKPENGIVSVTGKDAGFAFYSQAVSGDPVDGYPGCPKVGAVRAERLVADAREQAQAQDLDPHAVVWNAVVLAYEKAGLDEDFALAQARCARILQHGDYNWKTHTVNLWEPTRLES